MSTALQLIPGTLATNCYPSDPQVLYNEMFEKGNAQLRDMTGILIQDSEPDPEDRDQGWLRLTAPGGPPVSGRVLTWYGDRWLTRHPYAPDSGVRLIWIGTLAELDSFDGGSGGAVTDVTGPFWERDTNFDGRMPVGVGTVPDTTTAVTVDTNVGSGQVTLSSVNIPQHSHEIGVESSDVTGSAEDGQLRDASGDVTWISTWNQTAVGITRNWGGAASDGATTPFDSVPAARGVYFLKRTARIYYTT